MSPNDELTTPPTHEPAASAQVPVFHNPLTQQPLQQSEVPKPAVVDMAQPVVPTIEFAVPQMDPAPQPEQVPTAMPAPQAEQARVEPSVLDLQGAPIPHPVMPAPVRLAPVPKGEATHAAGLAATAHTQPFQSIPPAHVAEAAMLPIAKKPSKMSRKPLILGIVCAVILVLGGTGWYMIAQLTDSKKSTSQPTPTPTSLKRDTTRKAIQPGNVAVISDCYGIQVPVDPDIQVNKDCRMSIVYGSAKTSTVVISPYKDFDLVGSDTQEDTKQFDSNKILDGLIASTTSGRTIADRQSLKVGNIDTVKITSTSSANGETVAYAFIVLPESDQQFKEKKIIAFIVTGAYNDDSSRAAYDAVLAHWQWQ